MKVIHFDGGDATVNDNGEILNLHGFCWRKWSAGEKRIALNARKDDEDDRNQNIVELFIESSIEQKCKDNKRSSETAVNNVLKISNQDV